MFCDDFIPKHGTTGAYNSRIIKKSFIFNARLFTIIDFYIIDPASMDFLLDRIHVKRPRSSCIPLFLKNIFVPACFSLDNI